MPAPTAPEGEVLHASLSAAYDRQRIIGGAKVRTSMGLYVLSNGRVW